ncbi:MAG: hypothetical protein AAGJ94_10855 [Pseudomonadota bacterium]
MDPSAALIPLPEPMATILPADAPERRPDGFANILADPATVPGLPRDPRRVAADEAQLAAEGRATERTVSGINTASTASVLAARGRTHVAAARAEIERSGRPQSGLPPRDAQLGTTAPTPPSPPVDPGRPLNPDDPLPRAVGVPPFQGNAIAQPSQAN